MKHPLKPSVLRLKLLKISVASLLVGLSALGASAQTPTTNAPPAAPKPEQPEPDVPVPTSEILVQLKPGTDVTAFAQAHGLIVKHTLLSDATMHVLKAGTEAIASVKLKTLISDNVVVSAQLNGLVKKNKDAFVPNDPYFGARSFGAYGSFPGQWHLYYPARPEFDSNVQGAWNRDITGNGVIIGIVDDGLEYTHPDLAANYSATDSYDFSRRDSNPYPHNQGTGSSGDNHGTSVAGVAAARGGNGIGGTGAAPYAKLAGLQLDFTSGFSVASEIDAIKYHSSGADRAIRVKNHSYGAPAFVGSGPAVAAALKDSATAGTIHCFSAGNARGSKSEDSNKAESKSSPDVIAVAALASSGIYASYSSFGANVFVTAPSSSFRGGEYGITTTDRAVSLRGYNYSVASSDGDSFPDTDYASGFGGTSSASPLVAGIMALGVQVNSSMNVRLAKHLLVRSSTIVHSSDNTVSSDGGWKLNSAGFRFNQNYGFGLINADEFTRQAVLYSGVTPLTTAGHSSPVSVNAAIPDNGEIIETRVIGCLYGHNSAWT